MIALWLSVLAASLLGSLHCAGMCGPLVAVAVGLGGPGAAGRFGPHLAYHLGRLVIYLLIGAVAGAVGATLDLGGALIGFQRLGMAVAGGLLVLVGGAALLTCAGVRMPTVGWPAALERLAAAVGRAACSLRPIPRAVAVGLCTGLLPCGWLHAFTITAIGTAHPACGAMVMLAFWAGTLPVLVGLGAGLHALTGRLRERIPVLTASVVVVLGLITAAGRLTVPPPTAAAGPVDIRQAVERVRSLPDSVPPCCRSHGR